MVPALLPAAFAYLADERNVAADAALAEVLPHLEPAAQSAAFELLLKRAHIPTLAVLVARFGDFDERLQGLVVAGADGLSAGLRMAVLSPAFRQRANAIDIITRSNSGKLAYLLADALRARCRKTRELAAAGLHQLTARLLDRSDADAHSAQIESGRAGSARPIFPGGHGPSYRTAEDFTAQANLLAQALATAVRRWETHFQPKVLEAALWLADLLEPVILKKLEERRTKIVLALRGVLAGATDPRLARAVLRFLAVPALREAAARGISRARDPAFLQTVLTEARLLDDSRIERGCRWIRGGKWIQETVHLLLNWDGGDASGAVRLLAASGAPQQRKIEAYRELIDGGRSELRRAAFTQLLRDKSGPATRLLSVLATRTNDDMADAAVRELRRRSGEAGPTTATLRTQAVGGGDLRASDAFERYWTEFDKMTAGQRAEASASLRAQVPNLSDSLRRRLRSKMSVDRARALNMILSLHLAKQHAEEIYLLVYDPDPVVRGCAVAVLAELPGATTHRLLYFAINDPDERVQANAIEVLDRLDLDERIALTEPKLKSASGRVRAGAVKSLLRAEVHEAGETLLHMLEDQSPMHRLSALWVVERLMLQTASDRVTALSDSDPDERVRQRARHVLERLTGSAGSPLPSDGGARSASVPTCNHQAARLFDGSFVVAGALLWSRPQLTEALEAIRDRFRQGGSIWVFLLVVLALVGIFALASYLTQRQQTQERKMQKADPAQLFSDLLTKLGVTPQQRQVLGTVVTEMRLAQPAVILLSPALFDRYLGDWQARQHAEAGGRVRAWGPELVAETRRTLFPPSES
jgi:hypothetical protein